MRLTRVQPILLSYPLPEPVVIRFHGGERTIVKRDTMLVRVEADNGLVGYAPGPGSEKAEAAIRETIAPFLEGRTLADPDALRILFLHGPGADPDLARLYSMVEIALHDLIGKALEVPLSELLGGRVRDRVRLYGSAGIATAPEALAEEAAAIADMGFPAYKFRLAMGPEYDLRTVEFLRKTTGPEFELIADGHAWGRMANRSYPFSAVQQLAGALAGQRLLWLEEPWISEDHAAYRRLKEKGAVALAGGMHEAADDGLLDLVQSRGVDYIQMDILRQGGYPAARLILTEAAREGIRFVFRTWATALDIVAAAHLAICWPEMVAEWIEFPCYSGIAHTGMYPFPLADDILSEPLDIQSGDLVVPHGPGLGVAINESAIQRYRWLPGPWSWVRLESPPVTYSFENGSETPDRGRRQSQHG